MNKELIDNRDIKISSLKKTIESYKKYDQERKEYYKKSLIRLGELESLLSEIEEGDDKNKKTIIEQRRELCKLNLIIKSKDLKEVQDYYLENDEELQNLKEKEKNIILKRRNKKLKEENKKLKDTISNLLSKINNG